MTHLILVLLFFAAATGAGAPVPKKVELTTSDKLKIAADYYAGPGVKGRAPVAILIHMYPADRKSWQPLVPTLHEAGFAVLAYDIRGKGDSAGPADAGLARRYADRDPELFKDAWKDVEAAMKWLEKRKDCDPSNIALIGASIGCSISIEYAGRDEAVKAVVCLSPGTNYFGVDSTSAIRKVRTRKILLIAPEEEYKAVQELVNASKNIAIGGKYPGTRAQHGTNLLVQSYPRSDEIKKTITNFIINAVHKAPMDEKKGTPHGN